MSTRSARSPEEKKLFEDEVSDVDGEDEDVVDAEDDRLIS